MKRLCVVLLVVLAVTVVATEAMARVKLVTLPDRDRVIIHLDNPQFTLIQEERTLTLQEGMNQVDFSWRGVNIDAASIQIQPLDHPIPEEGEKASINIISTSYPPGEPALIWNVWSDKARTEKMRISYLLSGIQRIMSYRAVAGPDEKDLTLRTYLKIANQSGEDFKQTEIKLDFGRDFQKDIQHQETIEMLTERVVDVPMKKVLTWDAQQLPWVPEEQRDAVGIPMTYEIRNDKASKLGEHTLPFGKARIFIEKKGQDGEPDVTFIGEDWGQETAVDRDMKLYIGQSRDIVVTQRKTKNERTRLRRNDHNRVVLYDTDEVMKLEVENFKKDPAQLVIVEHIPGYWKMKETSHKYERKDAYTIEFKLALKPEEKQTITYNYERMNVQPPDPELNNFGPKGRR